jgi:hypothetical protein
MSINGRLKPCSARNRPDAGQPEGKVTILIFALGLLGMPLQLATKPTPVLVLTDHNRPARHHVRRCRGYDVEESHTCTQAPKRFRRVPIDGHA